MNQLKPPPRVPKPGEGQRSTRESSERSIRGTTVATHRRREVPDRREEAESPIYSSRVRQANKSPLLRTRFGKPLATMPSLIGSLHLIREIINEPAHLSDQLPVDVVRKHSCSHDHRVKRGKSTTQRAADVGTLSSGPDATLQKHALPDRYGHWRRVGIRVRGSHRKARYVRLVCIQDSDQT